MPAPRRRGLALAGARVSVVTRPATAVAACGQQRLLLPNPVEQQSDLFCVQVRLRRQRLLNGLHGRGERQLVRLLLQGQLLPHAELGSLFLGLVGNLLHELLRRGQGVLLLRLGQLQRQRVDVVVLLQRSLHLAVQLLGRQARRGGGGGGWGSGGL